MVSMWFRFAWLPILVLLMLPRLATSTSAISCRIASVPSNSDAGSSTSQDAGSAAVPPANVSSSGVAISTNDASTNDANSTATGSAADQMLLLEVLINGHSVGKIGEFTFHHGMLMARPDELRDLGLRVPGFDASAAGGLVALSNLPGLTWTLDLKKQELHITADNDRLVPQQLQPDDKEKREGRRVIESGTGITLNYDAVSSFASGQVGATTSLDLRGFSPWGIASSDWLTYAGANSGPGKKAVIRLDSAYTFADVNTMRRYSLGDFITGGLAWTRPVHLEGVQIRSDFSMRPDLVTFPLPSLTGSAAVPSAVTVLADGNLVVSNQVDAGPFEIPQLPVISGAGTISMTVTNAMGQQVTLTQPFYASTALLAPGLQTFSVESGLVRKNWGSASFDYGKVAGMAIYRRGLTPKFTLEGSMEGTLGALRLGGGGEVQVGNLGIINFAASASNSSGHFSAQLSAGAQRIGRIFSLGAAAIVAGRNFRDVAAMNGAGVPRKQISAFTSLSLRRFGSLGAAYAGIDLDAAPTQMPVGASMGQHSHVVSASYSRQFHHTSFYVSEFRNLIEKGSNGLQAGLTIPFGRRRSADVSGTSDGNGQVQIQQSAPQIGDWGYQAYVSAGEFNRAFGQVQYKSPVGLFTAGVDHSSGQTILRLESQGAFSFVDGGLFPSNTIYDSFAVVDTSPVSHVHVMQENRDVGSTNSAGRLLVPDMRSFDLNRIGIVATDIPGDASISVASGEIRPQDRSGVVVRFPIKFSHGALLRLVDETGAPMPLGCTATLRATGVAFPVGYDGDVYIENLNPHNELNVERVDGRRCTAAFDYLPIPGDIPSIGPLRCQEQAP